MSGVSSVEKITFSEVVTGALNSVVAAVAELTIHSMSIRYNLKKSTIADFPVILFVLS